MKTLIYNIGCLVGCRHEAPTRTLRGRELSQLPMLEHAWLLFDNASGTFLDFGNGTSVPAADRRVNARGAWVFPSFCDSHTHIIYAGSREEEWCDKISGLSYEEIARRGGGILNSADQLRRTSEVDLYKGAHKRLEQMTAMGTGAVEIKSGYGLNVASELKMLRVARRLSKGVAAPLIRTTFLGAHAVARDFYGLQDEYVDYVIKEMLPAVTQEGLADFVDVFCDRGFFTPQETAQILEAGARYGLRPKIHADELAATGATAVGCEHGALSVDHLESAGADEIALLAKSDTIATLLPGASFFSALPYAPARALIDAGAAVALASDYNPGSSPSGSMCFVMTLACTQMRMQPREALNAATVNGAAAMGLLDSAGSITPGLTANFFLTDPLPSVAYLTYAYTEPMIRQCYLRGRLLPPYKPALLSDTTTARSLKNIPLQ